MEVAGYYKKKEDVLIAKDKVMLTLLALTGAPTSIRKSTYIKGVSLNCNFNYVTVLNEMQLKDGYIRKGANRSFFIEFPLKDRRNLPKFQFNDLVECLVVNASSSSSIKKNMHIVTRIITKESLVLAFEKAGFSSYIVEILDTYPPRELYTSIIKKDLKSILERNLSVSVDLLHQLDVFYESFSLNGGYLNYKRFFEVGATFKEARGAIDLFASRAFEIIEEDPYKLLKIRGESFKKADIRALKSFKEDMWGIRRASIAFLSTMKHITERGRYEAGSTAVSIKQIQYYGYLYMIGRAGAKTAHSYIEDILTERGHTSRWKVLKGDEGRLELLKLLFKGAGSLKELDTEYLLKPKNLPLEIAEKTIEEMNASILKENPDSPFSRLLTMEKYKEDQEANNLVFDKYITNKIEKGETVVKFESSKRVATLGDFLLEMFTLSSISKIIMRETPEHSINTLKESYEKTKDSLEIPLTKTQEEGIESFINSNFSILTGGPGTGKTFTVAVIVDIAKKAGLNFKLLAPTGKAAKRMTELADGEPAQTIHMLLGFKGGTFFEVDQLDSYDFVIIDEFSMVDPILFGKFLSAIHPSTKVLLVGDPDQLPSIRAGNLLGDLIRISSVYEDAYGTNIVTRLIEIMRQEKVEGEYPAIVKISQNLVIAAKTGNHSVFLKDINENLEGDINFPDTLLLVSKSATSEAEEKKNITKAFRQLLSNDAFNCDTQYFSCSQNINKKQEEGFFEGFKKGDWQILTPFRQAGGGKLSSDMLNPIAREHINSSSYGEMKNWAEEMIQQFGIRNKWKYNLSKMFSPGDKILCTSNLYKPTILGVKADELLEVAKELNFPVVNGDIGVIEEIYTPEATSNYGIPISSSMEEIPEIYRTDAFLKVYGPFYKIKFEGKQGYTWFNSYDAEKLSLGYVFTVHKAQGSEYDNLMVIITTRAKNFVTPKMLYTAMTRAKKKLFLVVSENVLREILLLAQKDIRFTVINQLGSLTKDIPFGEKMLNEYPEEFKKLMRVYLNWIVIIRNRYNKMNNFLVSPYDFILKIMHSNIVGIEGDDDDTEE